MSRRFTLAFLFAGAALLLLAAAAAPKDKKAAVVKVDCAEGESINSALSKNPDAQSLVVEVSGLCHENVLVTRDRVTLRGADPEVDGISAAADEEEPDAALWVRGAQFVTVENLKLTGGFSGLSASLRSRPSPAASTAAPGPTPSARRPPT